MSEIVQIVESTDIPISPNLVFVDGGKIKTSTAFSHSADIFGPGSNPSRRILENYEQLKTHVQALKLINKTIVLTLGVFDLIHHGQSRYLEEAKARGDYLIVGLELDEAVKLRKGPLRPVVPFVERAEMLCHLRHVDLVMPVLDYNPQTGLSGIEIHKIIQPDYVVASVRSFQENESTIDWFNEVSKNCGQAIILASQAEASTTNHIRNFVIHYTDIIKRCSARLQKTVSEALKKFNEEVSGAVEQL